VSIYLIRLSRLFITIDDGRNVFRREICRAPTKSKNLTSNRIFLKILINGFLLKIPSQSLYCSFRSDNIRRSEVDDGRDRIETDENKIIIQQWAPITAGHRRISPSEINADAR